MLLGIISKAQDNRGQLQYRVSFHPSFNWQNPQTFRTCDPKIIHNLIPPPFLGKERPLAHGLVLLSATLKSENMEATEKIFQVRKKNIKTTFITNFSSPSKKKRTSPPVFFKPFGHVKTNDQAGLVWRMMAGFCWVSPTTPQDQESGLKLKNFAWQGSTRWAKGDTLGMGAPKIINPIWVFPKIGVGPPNHPF